MDLGVALPTSGRLASPANIVRIAQEAERLGYAAVWTYERLLRPLAELPAPDGSMQRIPEQYRLTYEPLETLSYVAAVTDRGQAGDQRGRRPAAPAGGPGPPLRHPRPAQRRAGDRRRRPGVDAAGVR
ncbi:MAG TPA: LLM class flavin-dependent oxidoreductase, partial [Actinomycetota bacterium]